jgi:hypothetical protein
MGMNTAGLAFRRSTAPIPDQGVLAKLFGFDLALLKPWSGERPTFDPRHPGDVIVSWTEKVVQVHSWPFVKAYFEPNFPIKVQTLCDALEVDSSIVFFIWSDYSNTRGFSLYRNRQFVRRRVEEYAEPAIQDGPPLSLEKRWDRVKLSEEEIACEGLEQGEFEHCEWYRDQVKRNVLSNDVVGSLILDSVAELEFGAAPLLEAPGMNYVYYRATDSRR